MKSRSSGQFPGVHRRRFGNAMVTALADGFVELSSTHLPGTTDEGFAAAVASPFAERGAYRSSINAYLVDIGGQLVLIDTGGAQSAYATLGNLEVALQSIGVDADSVDLLLMTHLHADHVGGAFDTDGNSVFTNARMMMRAEEYAHYHGDANLTEANRASFDLARRAVLAYGDKVVTFDADGEIVPGIEAVFLPGHTPGHTGYRIGTGEDALLIWGDIVHVPPVQLADPGIGVAFDADPALAERTRRAVLEQAVTGTLKIAGMHLPFPGFGSVERAGTGYRFVAAPYEYTPDA